MSHVGSEALESITRAALSPNISAARLVTSAELTPVESFDAALEAARPSLRCCALSAVAVRLPCPAGLSTGVGATAGFAAWPQPASAIAAVVSKIFRNSFPPHCRQTLSAKDERIRAAGGTVPEVITDSTRVTC